MSGTAAGSSFTAATGPRAGGTRTVAAVRRGWPRLRRVGRNAAAWSILPAAFLSLGALSVPPLSTPAAAPAPGPAQAGQRSAAHYYYATAFDSGFRNGVGPNTVHVQFYAKTDQLPDKSDHSLTEIFTRDAAGNAVEVGITTDTFWLPNATPHLFVSSWTDGRWNGYDARRSRTAGGAGCTAGVGNWKKCNLGAWCGRWLAVWATLARWLPLAFRWWTSKAGPEAGTVPSHSTISNCRWRWMRS